MRAKGAYSFIFITFVLFGCQEAPEQKEMIRPVKAIQVADPSLIRSRPFPGVTRAEDRVNLSFRVSGPLVDFPVDVGDQVKKGQILARIDPRDFEVTVKNAEANLERSKAALTFAESDYARADKIQKADPGAISASMVDRKREDRNKLRAEVKSLEAQLDGEENQLSYTQLKAPFDGVVVATYADNFEFVQEKQAVLRILDTSHVEMVVDIPESLISYIGYVKKIIVHLDVFPEMEFAASIKEIGTEASSTTRTYPVTLLMKQPKEVQILAGMSGEAKFIGKVKAEDGEAIIIPLSAVFSDEENQKSFVWVIADGIAHRREVQLDALINNGIRVTKGIKPSEWVAIAGVHHIRDGQQVTILEADRMAGE